MSITKVEILRWVRWNSSHAEFRLTSLDSTGKKRQRPLDFSRCRTDNLNRVHIMFYKALLVLLMFLSPPGVCACFAHHHLHEACGDQAFGLEECKSDCDQPSQNHQPNCPSFKPSASKLFATTEIQTFATTSSGDASLAVPTVDARSSHIPSALPHAPDRPLYLTHCTFTI